MKYAYAWWVLCCSSNMVIPWKLGKIVGTEEARNRGWYNYLSHNSVHSVYHSGLTYPYLCISGISSTSNDSSLVIKTVHILLPGTLDFPSLTSDFFQPYLFLLSFWIPYSSQLKYFHSHLNFYSSLNFKTPLKCHLFPEAFSNLYTTYGESYLPLCPHTAISSKRCAFLQTTLECLLWVSH